MDGRTDRRTDGRKDGRTEGQTNGHKFNTSLAEVITTSKKTKNNK